MPATSEWLPIGSVVYLHGGEGLVMITGLAVSETGKQEIWDYVGVRYPQGAVGTKNNVLFNKDSVDDVFYIGFRSEEDDRLRAALAEWERKQAQEAGGES